MSIAANRVPPAAAWALAGLAVVLLYFLTAPAVEYGGIYYYLRTLPENKTWVGVLTSSYWAPYHWLQEHTPLRTLLEPYGKLFERLVFPSATKRAPTPR